MVDIDPDIRPCPDTTGHSKEKAEMSVDIEELKALVREPQVLPFAADHSVAKLLHVIPNVIAELESLREQLARKPDAKRITGEILSYATGAGLLDWWAQTVVANHITSIIERELAAPDKPTGLAAIMGKWPGDETDEQIDQAMKEMGI